MLHYNLASFFCSIFYVCEGNLNPERMSEMGLDGMKISNFKECIYNIMYNGAGKTSQGHF